MVVLLCAATAAVAGLVCSQSSTKDPSIEELEQVVARAKAGQDRVGELKAAIRAAMHLSKLISQQVIGLEAELEGTVRLVDALEVEDAEVGARGATRNLWRALLDIQRSLLPDGSGEEESSFRNTSLEAVWNALPVVDQHVYELEVAVRTAKTSSRTQIKEMNAEHAGVGKQEEEVQGRWRTHSVLASVGMQVRVPSCDDLPPLFVSCAPQDEGEMISPAPTSCVSWSAVGKAAHDHQKFSEMTSCGTGSTASC